MDSKEYQEQSQNQSEGHLEAPEALTNKDSEHQKKKSDRQSQKEKIEEITKKIEQGVKDIFTSENYKNYLRTLSKFTSYSFNNTILIMSQCSTASYVAGYQSWIKNFQRHVKKGEKAIQILAPCNYKRTVEKEVVDKNNKPVFGENGKPLTEKTEVEYTSFKVTSVFDYSQTEGKELPQLAHKLNGTVEGYSDFMTALTELAPVPVEFSEVPGNANGYYDLVEKKIVIDKDLDEIMKCKTGLHEVAHSILHDRENGIEKDQLPDRRTREVEAESVAYTICQYYNLDSSDYSFGYILGWSSGRELSELKSSMERIRATANDIIKGIDEKLNIKISNTITMDQKTELMKKPSHTRRRHR